MPMDPAIAGSPCRVQTRPRPSQSPVASRPKITVGQITQPAWIGTLQRGTAHATNAHFAAINNQAQSMKRETRGVGRERRDMAGEFMPRSLPPHFADRKHRPRFP